MFRNIDKRELVFILAVALFIRVIIHLPLIESNYLLSDEIYYYPSGTLLLSRLFPNRVVFREPYTLRNVTVVNGTIHIVVSIDDEMPLGGVILAPIDWRNLEHPGFAKLVYGSIYVVFGRTPVSVRIFLLSLSMISYTLFFYFIVDRYRVLGFISCIVFIALHGLAPMIFIGFLDSLMISIMLLSIVSYVYGYRRLSIVLLSLSSACKVTGLLPSLGFFLVETQRTGFRKALVFLIAPAVSLLLSYSINLVFASPWEIVNAVRGMARGLLLQSCSSLFCLFSLYEKWGIFTIYPPLIWLWIIYLSILVVQDREPSDEESLALYVSIANIVFTAFISVFRSIYVFYYLPAHVLTPVPLSLLLSLVREKISRCKRDSSINSGGEHEGAYLSD